MVFDKRKEQFKEAGEYLRVLKEEGKPKRIAQTLTGAGYVSLGLTKGIITPIIHLVETAKGMYTLIIHPITSGKEMAAQFEEEPFGFTVESVGQMYSLGKITMVVTKGAKD